MSLKFYGIRLAGKPPDTFWNLSATDGKISSIGPYTPSTGHPSPDGRLVTPSLCHPHIHLDKCFLLSHPRYADLSIQKGDFAEAMSLTRTNSEQAKSRFTEQDIIERGRALIQESISFGVTHMRAFVEVDLLVGTTCLLAGLYLKHEFAGCCEVQICAFAQEPIMSYETRQERADMLRLMKDAAKMEDVDVLGSTPYVETDSENERKNIEFMLKQAADNGKMLDFHIDYHTDWKKEPLLGRVLKTLWRSRVSKKTDKTVCFGHCTRLSLFTPSEWVELEGEIGDKFLKDLVHFVGLPTSDLFMMNRPEPGKHEEKYEEEVGKGGDRGRGTLQVLEMVKGYGLNASIGVNNVGNAFTPQGSLDPLALASLGVGIYQAGTSRDAEILFECVSGRAKRAIGFESGLAPLGGSLVGLKEGDAADFIVFAKKDGFRQRKTIQDVVYDAGPASDREVYKGGRLQRNS